VEAESRHDETMFSAVLLGKGPDGVENLLEAVAQVIHDDDIVSILEELESGVGSDITESTKDHDIVLAIVSWENIVCQVRIEGVVEQLRGTRAGGCRALE
jgi:hypothetical protein